MVHNILKSGSVLPIGKDVEEEEYTDFSVMVDDEEG